MVGTTKPFGQSSNNNAFCPRTQSVFGQNNNIISNPFSPNPFDASTPFGAPQASSSPFGVSSQEFESSTPAFGASSDPAFGSSPSPFGATSAFGQNSFVVSSPQSSPSRSTTQQSQPAFVHSTVGPCKPFGASKTSSLGASSTPAFGGSSTPSFGTTNSPGFGTSPSQAFGSGGAFGATNTSEFGASSTPSFSFGSSPSFGSGSFASTQDPFGAQGTVMLYALTTEVDSGTSSSQPVGKIQSIFALHVHKDKCHEELRWEDYQRVHKGGQRSSGQSPGGATFGVTNPQPNIFSQSPTFSQTSSSPTSNWFNNKS